jgi:ADP-ribose pyrophosphatase YjhB (NUDIX family)
MWPWKKTLARVIRWPLTRFLMNLGIRIIVPRRRVGVALIAFNEDEHVFMLHHIFRPHAPWGLPGGWMGRHESPENCIQREIREETGLDIQLGPVVHVAQEAQNAFLTIFFLGRLQPGSMELSAEILEAAWVDPFGLPPGLFASSRLAIEKAMHYHPQWLVDEQVQV